ncbi:MAG TPA: nitrite/sulfite reductase [Candidatus Omnitrophota bacterium]|nr:nitrite/sulfite reductase [Candidatus Omnitrophota bacterium]
MPKKPFTPNFKTPTEALTRTEVIKQNALFVYREMKLQLKQLDYGYVTSDVETMLKSMGVYLEFDRDKPGRGFDQDWMYMIRFSNPGGGPINREQWRLLDDLSEKYTKDPQGHSSIRFTTRENIQFHWIKKSALKEIIRTLAEVDLRSMNGCGDNTRNVMGCPLSRFSDVFNAWEWARKAGAYFQLPLEPFIKVFEIDPNKIRKPGESYQYGKRMLNRKFKIAFSTVHRDGTTGNFIPDNCVELLTHDLAVAPIVQNGKVEHLQVYVGGGQGERNGYPTMAALAKPLAIVTQEQLMPVLDAVVKVHEEWGDRENRHWARLKYVIKAKGADWYRDQVSARLGFPLGKPDPSLDYGRRHLHFGWHKQPSNGLWAYGAYLENGRISDAGRNGKLKSMIRHTMEKYPIEIMVTPNQDALFTNIPEAAKKDFENELKNFGFGQINGKSYTQLRLHSGACVGLNTCRLSYTESEQFEPELLDQLEKMGWGHMKESIGITGCERQCFRPATKTIGLVGTGADRYMFKLFGEESARTQGRPLTSDDGEKIYLRTVPRDKCAVVIDTLFKFYEKNKEPNEEMGPFHRRIGAEAIINHLKENSATADLMLKPFPADFMLE